MSQRLQVWLGVLCGIAVVALVIMIGPHLFADGARAARPFGGIALRSLLWIVIAFAAYWALVRTPYLPAARNALAASNASSRAKR